MKNFVQDVLLLGINKIDGDYGLYAAFMPFINEYMNLLTLTIFKPYFGLEVYPHHPKTESQRILKAVINVLAITGIVSNASRYGNIYSRDIGFVNGSLYAIFTFLIPNLFMSNVLTSKSRMVNLFVGLTLIYLLDLIVHGILYYYVHYIVNHFEGEEEGKGKVEREGEREAEGKGEGK